jgi:hypothetical protein
VTASAESTLPITNAYQAPDFLLYAGTAAQDLRALNAPVFGVITRINQITAHQTSMNFLPIAPGWDKRQADAWLAPIGTRVAGMGAVGTHVVRSLAAMASFVDATLTGSLTAERQGASTIVVALPNLVDDTTDDAVDEGTVEADPQSSPAFDAFRDLVGWLEATDEEVAAMAGVGRTTPYAWQRERREPRRSTVRRLFQTHAALSALVQRLGESDATQWLVYDDPTRRERVLAGDLPSVQDEMRPLLFGRTRSRMRPGSWVPDDESDE